MNPNADEPVNPGGTVAAATQTPKAQFENQFGSGSATPPVADDATGQGLIDTALAGLGVPPTPAGEDVPANSNQQPVEVTPALQLEKAPLDPMKEFKDEVAEAADKLVKALEEKKAA